MKIWRVEVDTVRTQFGEKSMQLVHANSATEAIKKACAEARRHGTYKRYDATSLELIGDAS